MHGRVWENDRDSQFSIRNLRFIRIIMFVSVPLEWLDIVGITCCSQAWESICARYQIVCASDEVNLIHLSDRTTTGRIFWRLVTVNRLMKLPDISVSNVVSNQKGSKDKVHCALL